MELTQTRIETAFFTLERLADGVYAAIARSGQGAWSNAGFIDLGDEVLVFDAFSTPRAARELRKWAQELTGKPVRYLVNSHYHGDHTFGNVAFEDTVIISTAVTRQLHLERNYIADLVKEQEEMQQYLQGMQEKIAAAFDPVAVLSLTSQMEEMTRVMESLPEMKHVLPTLLFDEKLVIHGSKRTVELYCFGGGHTESDAFLYIADEKIAFMGDLVTEHTHLPIFDPTEFIEHLERVDNFEIDILLPGHGNVGNKEQLHTIVRYLNDLFDLANHALQNGLTLEQILALGTGEQYSLWTGPNGDKRNITTVYNYLVEEMRR